jgi:hypothetical protein
MKKNTDKTLKGRMKHEEHVPHRSTPNRIPTPYIRQREKEKEKERNETSILNVNKNTQTKNAHMCKKKKKEIHKKGEMIKPRKSISPNYKHI